MIVRSVVGFELLLTPLLRVAHVAAPFLQADGRHANFGEREMVRAIERTLFGSRVWCNCHPALFGNLFNDRLERRTLRTKWNEVARRSEHVHRIEVDVRI